MSPRSMWPGYTVTNLRIMALPLAANCSCREQSGTGQREARDKLASAKRETNWQREARDKLASAKRETNWQREARDKLPSAKREPCSARQRGLGYRRVRQCSFTCGSVRRVIRR